MAKKSVKTVVQTMNGRILTNREASRIAQNERRKAQRRLARILSEETGEKVNWKNATDVLNSMSKASEQAKALGRTIKGLQAKKIEGTNQRQGYSVSLEREAESIATFTQIRFGRETLSKKSSKPDLKRRNEMFTHQINQSTMKNGFSVLSRDETKAFYASTMDMWRGLSSSDNLNAQIMMKFGVNDLSQVYKLLTSKDLKKEDFGFKDEETFQQFLKEMDERVQLSKRREIVQEELKSIRDSKESGGTTEDEQYNGKEEKTAETSPEYLNRIITRIATMLNNG